MRISLLLCVTLALGSMYLPQVIAQQNEEFEAVETDSPIDQEDNEQDAEDAGQQEEVESEFDPEVEQEQEEVDEEEAFFSSEQDAEDDQSEEDTEGESDEADESSSEESTDEAESEFMDEIDSEEDAESTDTSDEPDEASISGIDTVDLDQPRGNWLYKRIWWERARDRFEQLRNIVTEVLDSRVTFFAQRAELDKNIVDPFYLEIGMKQGQLQAIVEGLIKQLERARDKKGTLNMREREHLSILQNEQKTLEQLSKDMVAISKLEQEADEALGKLMEQINKVRSYEKEAWSYFKEIARVLNDEKARELFHKMNITSRNIADVQQYIKEKFTTHFHSVVEKIKEQIERVKTTINELKEKGISISVEIEKAASAPNDADSDEGNEDGDDEHDARIADSGFMHYVMAPIYMIGSALQTVWDYTVFAVSWPFKMLFNNDQSNTSGDQIDDQDDVIDVEQEEPLSVDTVAKSSESVASVDTLSEQRDIFHDNQEESSDVDAIAESSESADENDADEDEDTGLEVDSVPEY